MILNREYGIVLRSFFPNKRVLTLLTFSSGKIRAASASNYVSGSLISYVPKKTGSYIFLQQVELIRIPLDLTESELIFLHHLLEVTYHFLCYNDIASDVYKLLLSTLHHSCWWAHQHVRYLIVFKLLALLGHYPEESVFHTPSYYQFVREPLARLKSCSIPSSDIQKIVRWLRKCISSHPDGNIFNTLSFYSSRESHD